MNNWNKVSTFVSFTTKGITPKYVQSSSIIVLNQKCIRNNRIDYSFSQYTDDTKSIPDTKFVKRGDILVNSTGTGTAGRCAFVTELPSHKRLIVDSHILILRCHSYYEAKCLSYILFSFEKSLMSFMTGSSGQSELDKVVLLNLKTKIPTNSTIQRQIANVLSELDAKIELNTRINYELVGMTKWIYDYWFVQFDFPNSKGKPYKSSGGKMEWNEELKREIPVGWKDGELIDIANITMGQSPPGESYNEEGEGMIFYQGCTDFGSRFPTVRKFTREPTRFAKEGDILLSVRAPVGTLNFAKEDCCIGRGLAALNSQDNCQAYLFGVMINLKQIFDRRNVNGTTFGSITKDDLFSLKVVKPEKNILKQYHSIVNPAFEKQNKLELENIQLAELRDWLLPMLMNGQVKVSGNDSMKESFIDKADKQLINKTSIKERSNKSDSNLEMALIVAAMKNKLAVNYGEVAIQKTVFNISAYNPLIETGLKKYTFINSNYGTYSYELKNDLKKNNYLIKKTVCGKEVFAINPKNKKQVEEAYTSKENKPFISAVNNVLSTYKHPFINKETDKIELLNTITKLILDLKTVDLNKIYLGMRNWKIKQKGFKTKADKFSKVDVEKMLSLIKKNGLLQRIINK